MRRKGISAAMAAPLVILAVTLLVTRSPASGLSDRDSDSSSLPTAYFHPGVLYFKVGTSSTRTTTLTNTSAETLNITSFDLRGINDCSMTDSCGFSLHGGASCSVSLTCSPRTPGRNTELTEYDNSAAGHHSVSAVAK
jgi:hypothetical protein